MRSSLPKVLHKVRGKAMIRWVVESAKAVQADPILAVVGFGADQVAAELQGSGVILVSQARQLGTAHAVEQTRALLAEFEGDLLVLNGDVPLTTTRTLQRLIHTYRQSGARAAILSAEVEDPAGYGRIVRSPEGLLARVVEDADATEEEGKINEINAGIYVFHARTLFENLSQVSNRNRQREYYLPEVLPVMLKQKLAVIVEKAEHFSEILGINTRDDLRKVEEYAKL